MPVSFENPTAELRFVERFFLINPADPKIGRNVRILQQKWDIYENGLPAVTRSEWRDVPCLPEEQANAGG